MLNIAKVSSPATAGELVSLQQRNSCCIMLILTLVLSQCLPVVADHDIARCIQSQAHHCHTCSCLKCMKAAHYHALKPATGAAAVAAAAAAAAGMARVPSDDHHWAHQAPHEGEVVMLIPKLCRVDITEVNHKVIQHVAAAFMWAGMR